MSGCAPQDLDGKEGLGVPACGVRKPPATNQLQLQGDFNGAPLSRLATLGLKVYEWVPDFRRRCPLCAGAGCAVRQGLYFRRVVDGEGAVYERFPVSRFLCQRKGPRQARDRTFSVLPTELVPRRRFALPLMLWVLELRLLRQRSVQQVLDALATLPADSRGVLLPDEVLVYRILHLFSRVYERLQSFPVPETPLAAGLQDPRSQAQAVFQALTEGQARGSPLAVVGAFQQRYFPHLLFDLRLSH